MELSKLKAVNTWPLFEKNSWNWLWALWVLQHGVWGHHGQRTRFVLSGQESSLPRTPGQGLHLHPIGCDSSQASSHPSTWDFFMSRNLSRLPFAAHQCRYKTASQCSSGLLGKWVKRWRWRTSCLSNEGFWHKDISLFNHPSLPGMGSWSPRWRCFWNIEWKTCANEKWFLPLVGNPETRIKRQWWERTVSTATVSNTNVSIQNDFRNKNKIARRFFQNTWALFFLKQVPWKGMGKYHSNINIWALRGQFNRRNIMWESWLSFLLN